MNEDHRMHFWFTHLMEILLPILYISSMGALLVGDTPETVIGINFSIVLSAIVISFAISLLVRVLDKREEGE